MTATKNTLEIKELSIRLGSEVLINNLNLRIEAGETVVLMGASGSGKSTLLSWLSGVLDPTFNASGQLWLNNQRIDQLPCEKRRVGLLFQDALLFPHFNVGENLIFGIPGDVNSGERKIRAEQALADAGLSGFFENDPATLSGGQRARISLLRTLMAEPNALLLDEPYSRLDQALRAMFRQFVERHTKERQLPVLMVTHDREDIPQDCRCLSMADLALPKSTGKTYVR